MPRKKTKEFSLIQANSLRENAGLPVLSIEEILKIENNLSPDLSRFFNWFNIQPKKTVNEMYCFIFYDIEHNRIRRILAKYLEKKGCVRIQKSVFFAKVSRKDYLEITEIAKDLQNCYENHDTIMLLPIGEDALGKLNCIGKNFDFELMIENKHTIIF